MLRRIASSLPVSPPVIGGARHASVKQQSKKLVVATSRDAHGKKPLREIFLAVAVMQAMRVKYLSANSEKLIKTSEKVFGEFLTHLAVKSTFFRHFCGGEYTHELTATVGRLAAQGIGSIFDYAAEAEETSGEGITMRGMTAISKDSSIAYTTSPDKFDETMTLNLLCIGHAKLMVHKVGRGFAAIKFSGLAEPMLLARVSALMLSLRQAWVGFFNNEKMPPLEECRVVVGFSLNDRFGDSKVVREGIQKLIKQRGQPALSQFEEDNIMKLLDPQNSGKVDYLRYISVVTSALLDRSTANAMILAPFMNANPQLTEHEQSMWKDLERRVGIILAMAVELGVKVTIDAEQSYFQMAIDYITRSHQAKYNQKEAVIYNTYQCYLTYTPQRLKNDLARAHDEGWVWAGKMVRGAYMQAENETAEKNHYASPVWHGKTPAEGLELTHKCYNDAANHILDVINAHPDSKLGVLFGTHNPTSVKLIADRVADLKPNNAAISCAQLLGMADHLTVALARADVSVFKYVPYGPVRETILYLGRRAKENNAVLSGARPEEYNLLIEELWRRLRGGRRDK
ncbi:proline oxidase, putative [Bodo saltans]|uniref:Proline dehydrogenase n=1 Tax=Bodo saltans TaxID=75058 RepID=A0A0S4JS18_BODSA|nr:proline oxidase, putative [Bodo saltans]|eukprot:CUG93062.1 proline oxidase, putative [Bodo saltans]